jgi:branched-chain amino acid transport system substrate-binding protein
VIDDKTAYGEGVAKEFIKGAKGKGAEVVATEHTTDKSNDFAAILTTIKAKQPDLIFFGGMDAVAGPMLKQMKALGINAKFMGGDGICTADLPKLAGDGIGEGQVVCAEAGGVLEAQKKISDDWKAAFKKKYGVQVQIYAPYVYDSVMVMVEAMKQAGSAEPAKYLPVLKKIKYRGVTGDIAFDDKGDIKDGTLTLYTYKGGQREILSVTK